MDRLLTEASSRLDVETAPEWFHEGQLKAWASEALNVVVVAGAQGGKTAMQVYWLLRELARCKDLIEDQGYGVGLYVGPTLKLLRRQAIKLLRRYLESELRLGKFSESPEMKFQFSPEGCKRLLGFETDLSIAFAYAEDSSNLESVTACCAVWDEVGQKENKLDSLEALERRLSVARSSGLRDYGRQMGRILFGSTPYEWNFFKTHVHDPALKGVEGYELFNFPTWFNPRQDKATIEAKLNTMSREKWEMMHLGLFTQPLGMIYDCWDDELNTCPPFEIPEWWNRYVGMDYGSNNTAAVFFAEEQRDYSKPSPATGRMILYRTYHEGGMTTREHVKKIQELAGGTKPPYVRGGNHQEEATREAFTMAGLPSVEPRHNEVQAGINQVYAWMKTRNLVCFKTLDKFIDEVHSYSWELDDDDIPTDKILNKARYHRLDATRYISFLAFKEFVPVVKSKSRFDPHVQAQRIR